jgi:hypothetical protein
VDLINKKGGEEKIAQEEEIKRIKQEKEEKRKMRASKWLAKKGILPK